MITKYSHEGQEFKKHDLLNLGFEINEEKDIRKETLYNELTGEPLDEYKYTFNFVGFLINEANDIFSVFPKHFRVDNPIIDSGLIFDLISNHMQKRPDLYMGEEFGGHFESNYPFAAFFGVYNYYQRYGLYIENRKFVKPHVGGKINWKETIRKSNLYIAEEEKYDGYYLIVTSELSMADREVIERYKGLWKIEESFKITKSQFKSRPVYLRKKNHIEAHFFICFLALILIRLLEKETGFKFSISQLIDSIKNLSVTYLDENYYMLDYVDDVSKTFSEILNTDITKRFWRQSDIKNLIANSKRKDL